MYRLRRCAVREGREVRCCVWGAAEECDGTNPALEDYAGVDNPN